MHNIMQNIMWNVILIHWLHIFLNRTTRFSSLKPSSWTQVCKWCKRGWKNQLPGPGRLKHAQAHAQGSWNLTSWTFAGGFWKHPIISQAAQGFSFSRLNEEKIDKKLKIWGGSENTRWHVLFFLKVGNVSHVSLGSVLLRSWIVLM